MRIEEVGAPPPKLSPEMRYASLHRTIEAGLATERTWSEMVQVCVELNREDEAVRASRRIDDPTLRDRARELLRRHRIALDDDLDVDGEDQGSGASTTASAYVDEDPLIEQIKDGFRFLFLEHMPLTIVVATVTFPIVVGLGGFLTAGSPFFLLPAIALIPALSVVGLVGALGRRIMLDASRGIDDPPRIPSAGQLTRESARFLRDGAVLSLIFLGPGVLMSLLPPIPTASVFAAFVVGGMFLPMAMALRQVHETWQVLSPTVLFPAIVRGGVFYMAVVGVAAVIFFPSIACGVLTSGSHAYMTISVVGPLAVAPLFVVSRLLGQMVHERKLATALKLPEPSSGPNRLAAVGNMLNDAARRLRTPRTPLGGPSHPEAGHSRNGTAAAARPTAAGHARPARNHAATQAARARGQRPAPPGAARSDNSARAADGTARAAAGVARSANRPARSAGANARSKPAANPRAPRPGRAVPASATQPIEQEPPKPRPPAAVIGEPIPDLTKLPGVSVVRGDARERVGAASNPRRD